MKNMTFHEYCLLKLEYILLMPWEWGDNFIGYKHNITSSDGEIIGL